MKRYVLAVLAALASIFYLGLTVFSVLTGYYPRAVIDLALTAGLAYCARACLRRPVTPESRESSSEFGGVPGHVWVAHQRIMHDADYRKTIVDWVAANGINPSDVPGDARASIANGQLTIPLRVKTADGKYVIDPNDTLRLMTETVTVPVKVQPDSDVELWLMPRCETCGR